MLTARMTRGDATASHRSPKPLNEVDEQSAMLSSPVPDLKPGERMFRSRASGFSFPLFSTLPTVVGTTVIPGRSQWVRFEPQAVDEFSGLSFGELRTSDPAIIKKIEEHHHYGTRIVDAEEAYLEARENERAAAVDRATKDPEFAAALLKDLARKGVKGFAQLLSPKAESQKEQQPQA